MSHRLFSSPLLPFVSNPLTSYWPVAPGPVSPALVVSTSRSILWDTIRMGHCISLSHCSFCYMIFLWRNWNYFPIAQRVKFQLLKPDREAPQPLSFFLTSYFDLIHIHSPRFLAMGLLPFLSCVLDFPSSCVHVTFHSEASFPLVCFSIPLPPSLCNFYLFKSYWFISIAVEYCDTIEKWGRCTCVDMEWYWRHTARW